jgi:hypothetical protein
MNNPHNQSEVVYQEAQKVIGHWNCEGESN